MTTSDYPYGSLFRDGEGNWFSPWQSSIQCVDCGHIEPPLVNLDSIDPIYCPGCGSWKPGRALNPRAAEPTVEDLVVAARRESSRAGYLKLRFAVFQRDTYRCQICGTSAEQGARLEVDHKQPRAKGGKDTMDNLWVLCFECNRGKGTTEL